MILAPSSKCSVPGSFEDETLLICIIYIQEKVHQSIPKADTGLLDVRSVEIPLLSTVSKSNCRYQEAPGVVVWSDFLAQLPRRSIEIL